MKESSAIDARAIRLKSGKAGRTQAVFARHLGVPVKTVSNWEQGRRQPTGTARTLLVLIERALKHRRYGRCDCLAQRGCGIDQSPGITVHGGPCEILGET